MKTDLVFLGWCLRSRSDAPPLCTHAYAISTNGAKILYDNIDSCGHAIDLQIRRLGVSKNITWSLASQYKKYSKKQKHTALTDIYPYYDGIFHQELKHGKHFHNSFNN